MKTRSFYAALFLFILTSASLQPQPLPAGDPFQLIYRVSGVKDSGNGSNVGIATTFHCSSAANTPEKLRIILRDNAGGPIAGKTFSLSAQGTITASTHATEIFSDSALSPGEPIAQGQAAIFGTTTNFTCSAMIVNAASPTPSGIALHMTRHNPLPGTQE